ncbi:unnamed protein product [Phyllotreta striolata]|uniref:NADP-dependent oxidoreductase domain-containing protein n=1 Tax=Phyllotreta striolata TaxID=444603 RepID=A0A9N9TVX6_PHYSR|nr:unnamed protein product [Phyllotreta striolata]
MEKDSNSSSTNGKSAKESTETKKSPGKGCPEMETNKDMNTFITLDSGFKIPTIGLGTVFTADEDAEAAVEAALTIGYRHIDTAFMYQSEKAIGKVLKRWLDAGKITRDEIFVTSKLPFHGGQPEAVEPFLKRSLENLQLDYLDLYLIHFPVSFRYQDVDSFCTDTVPTDHIALWKAMEEQVKAGRTKNIGLSNFNTRQLDNVMAVAVIKPVVLQVEMHVNFQQRTLHEYCKNNNIVLVAYAPLGSPGLLKIQSEATGTPAPDSSGEDSSSGDSPVPPEDPNAVKLPALMKDGIVLKVAQKHKKTPAQILLRYLIEKHVCVIPKSSNPERLKENFLALTFNLDINDMAALSLLDDGTNPRILNLLNFFPQFEEHPEYPF